MKDYAKLSMYGKAGCHQGGGQFTTNAGAYFTPKSQSEIINSKRTIAEIRGRIDRQAGVVRRQSGVVQENLLKYLSVELPLCGAQGGGVTGYARGLWQYGTAALGSSTYEKCMAQRTALKAPLDKANKAYNKMTEAKAELYVDYAELMEFAPSTTAWTELCSQKLRLDDEFTQLSSEVVEIQSKVVAKINDEEEKSIEGVDFDKAIVLLQRLLQALEALLGAIKAIFDKFLDGITFLSKFIAEHPTAFWAGVGFIALTAIAFIFRPYLAIFGIGKT